MRELLNGTKFVTTIRGKTLEENEKKGNLNPD